MKMKKIFISLVVLFLLSCQDRNVDKFYYDTGELWYETGLLNKEKHTYYCKVYYKNGNLKEEGETLEDGTYDGFCKEYYSDGKMKWSGYYDKGIAYKTIIA